jgi:hypothetical protein
MCNHGIVITCNHVQSSPGPAALSAESGATGERLSIPGARPCFSPLPHNLFERGDMQIKTKQNYRFLLADGSTVDIGTEIPWGRNPDGSAAWQLVPDGIAADPIFAWAVSDGSLIADKMFVSGIASASSFGPVTITSP